MTDILVFVPGLLGSELLDDEGKIWPGSLLNGILGFSEQHFQRLLKPDVRVGGIVETAAGVVDIYGQWMRAFRRLRLKGGNALFSDQTNPPTLYTVPYDWRKAIEGAAKDRLAPVINKAKQDWGGAANIHIVGHSLGGLVTRYYLQSGKFNAEPGFASIKTFITFGTPHNGAPIALAAALGQHKTNFMSVDQSKRLANDPRYPALYQTFPLFDAPIIWKRMAHGRLEPIRLSDRKFATNQLKLNAANLDAALAFRKSLAAQPIPSSIRCFLLIGTRYETCTHFLWTGTEAEKVDTADAGDGTLSIEGAYVPGFQVQFTGESHVDLIASDVARETFQQLFDAEGLLLLVAGQVILSVRDLEVQADGEVHVRLHSDAGIPSFKGELGFERASLPPGQAKLEEKDFKPAASPKPTPISYSGPNAEAIAVKLRAPSVTGIYRLVLTEDGNRIATSANFVVAAP